jgi:hypothetical protein
MVIAEVAVLASEARALHAGTGGSVTRLWRIRTLATAVLLLLTLLGLLAPAGGAAAPAAQAGVTETWESDWGPLTITYGGTGSWRQSATAIGQITGSTYDPSARRLTFTYTQDWNQATGEAVVALAEDGRSMSGRWSQTLPSGEGSQGTWNLRRAEPSLLLGMAAPPAVEAEAMACPPEAGAGDEGELAMAIAHAPARSAQFGCRAGYEQYLKQERDAARSEAQATGLRPFAAVGCTERVLRGGVPADDALFADAVATCYGQATNEADAAVDGAQGLFAALFEQVHAQYGETVAACATAGWRRFLERVAAVAWPKPLDSGEVVAQLASGVLVTFAHTCFVNGA